MIVDDEPEIRAHIKNTIQWDQLGLVLVGEAGDADIAMEVAMLHRPQFVIMDICLPGKDGLSLAAELVEQNPEVKLLVISGFQDFSYAQKAISIGASDYLTKPVVPEELNGALRKMVDSFDAQKQEQQRMYAARQILEQNREMLSRWLLKMLLNGEHDGVTTEETLQQLGILDMAPIGEHCVVLMVAERNKGAATLNSGVQYATVKQYLEKRFQEAGFGVICYFDDDMVLSVLLSSKTPIDSGSLEELCIAARNEFEFYFGQRHCIGIGAVVDSRTMIGESAASARRALQDGLVLSDEQVISWQNLREKSAMPTQTQQLNRRWQAQLISCIREGNKAALDTAVDELVNQLETEERREFGIELLGGISKECGELGLYPWKTIDYPQIVRQLFAVEEAGVFADILKALCGKLIDMLRQRDSDVNRYLVVNAKKYIDANYSDSELSLEQVSDHVGLSKSYFCSLFHKIEGTTFKLYLMDLRMRHARRLLSSTDKKIYEISCDVGYNDTAYFNRVFKRINGITPLQFRNSDIHE
jgi:two-component system response regulator YesN